MNECAIASIIHYKTNSGNIVTASVVKTYTDNYGDWVKVRTEDGLMLDFGAELLKNALV